MWDARWEDKGLWFCDFSISLSLSLSLPPSLPLILSLSLSLSLSFSVSISLTCTSHVICEGIVPYTKEWRHVTKEWIMSCMSESCHIWMSHVIYEWVMSHMNESCHVWSMWIGRQDARLFNQLLHPCYVNTADDIWMRHITREWIMSHMNHVCGQKRWEAVL